MFTVEKFSQRRLHASSFFIANVAGISSEKLFDVNWKLEILKYYVKFYFTFFHRTKLRQPRGQRQLLENKQMLRNIRDF